MRRALLRSVALLTALSLMLWAASTLFALSALAIGAIILAGLSNGWLTGIILGVTLLLLIWIVGMSVRRRPMVKTVIRDVERGLGFRQELLTVWERSEPRNSPLLDALGQEARRRFRWGAALKAVGIRAFALSPQRYFWILGLFAIVVLVSAPDLVRNGMASLASRSTEFQGFKVGSEVRAPSGTLKISDIRYTVIFPAHSGRPPESKESLSGVISEPKGATVKLEVTVLAEEAIASLELKRTGSGGGETHSTEVARNRNVGTVDFQMTDSGSYWFEAMTEGGVRLQDPQRKPIVVLEDRVPEVAITFPDRSPFPISATAELVINYRATDDHGLTQVGVRFVYANQTIEENIETRFAPGRLSTSGRYGVTLSKWNFPRGMVELSVFAVDNNSVDGFQRGYSPAIQLEILDPDADRKKEDTELDAFTRHLVRYLGFVSELEFLVSRERLPGETARTGIITERQALEKSLPTIPSERASAEWRAALEALLATTPVQGPAAALSQHVAETERLIREWLRQGDAKRLAELATLEREIASIRQEIDTLLKEYKANPSDALKAKLERLAAELQRKMERATELANPFEAVSSEEIAQGGGESGQSPNEEMKDWLSALKDGKIDQAVERFSAMGSAIDQWLKQLQQNRESEIEALERSRYTAFNELREDLDRVRTQQNQLIERTERWAPPPLEEAEVKNAGARTEQDRIKTRQRKVESRLEELLEKVNGMEALQEEDRLDDYLKAAERSAGEAAEAVVRGENRQAVAHQQDVIAQLDALEQTIQSAISEMRQRMQSMREGRRMASERIELSKGEENAELSRIREEILRAMKSERPADYHDFLERYYDRLLSTDLDR